MEQIGKRLRALREGVRLTQVNMAEILGVQQSRINRFETGRSTPPRRSYQVRRLFQCVDGLSLLPHRRATGQAVRLPAPGTKGQDGAKTGK